MVVMNRHEYIKKARALLDDTNTFKPITSDPTTKLKNKLINILKMMKGEGNIDETPTRRYIPQGPVHQNSMGYRKYIKKMSL